ncbi:rhodanese-like domain-containing protein [Hugenholtzia roseola]|uniref:rhodanese-like domain-containing protein n=1 Tax=Hugenholtzia roseola TaxID=1002 RepID=UPI0004796CE0|nr:rhodanese-like domain-containing protein [Hugenholtzia roseola]
MTADITPQELKERLEKGETLFVLDVREVHEFEEDNLKGKLIPLGELPSRLSEIEQWKEKELIVHCRSGARSATAKKYLESQGFTQVRNLLEGILGYRKV